MRLRRLLAGCCLLAAAACSGGSSDGGPTAPTPTATTHHADKAAVDRALAQVLTGLHAAASAGSSRRIGADARALDAAATSLRAAGDAVGTLSGVPATVSDPAKTGLLRMAALVGRSGECLHRLHPHHPDRQQCLRLLRRAEAGGGRVARALISLSVYSSQSPTAFEKSLVAALRAGG